MNNEQIQQLADLVAFKKSLESSHSIPLNIDQAFRARFANSFGGLTTSTKSATSENQAVNEGGVATYSVLKAPDAFKQVTIGGSLFYVPVFT